jgi:putative nucleotidyltransferase with HDIG domain
VSSRMPFDQIASTVKDLPALPALVVELLTALSDEQVSAEQLAHSLSQDPALSAKTLRLANSSFYGMPRQISSIQEALPILGRRTIRTVVMAAGITGAFKEPDVPGFAFKAFWRHAVGTAMCGQALARELRMDSDIGFTVGLLHDLGQMALACALPTLYSEVLSHQQATDIQLIDAEQAIMGTDHAFMGARLAEHWHFSPAIVEAIEYHHAPAMHHGPGLVGLAHLADAFSHALGLSGLPSERVPMTPPEIWHAMAPDADTCLTLFARVEAQFDAICQALNV